MLPTTTVPPVLAAAIEYLARHNRGDYVDLSLVCRWYELDGRAGEVLDEVARIRGEN